MVDEVGRMLNDTARLSVLCTTLYMNCTGLCRRHSFVEYVSEYPRQFVSSFVPVRVYVGLPCVCVRISILAFLLFPPSSSFVLVYPRRRYSAPTAHAYMMAPRGA